MGDLLEKFMELEKSKKVDIQEKISLEEVKKIQKIKKISERLDDLPLNPSARLNLIKFLDALLTGESTTNKLKKSMKRTVINIISKF